jgi:hypothetical protein
MPSHLARTARAVAALLALAGSTAAAQPLTDRVAYGAVSSSSIGGIVCGSDTHVPGPGTTSHNCLATGASYNVLGRATNGQVEAYAVLTASADGDPAGKIWSALGRGQWGDRLVFTGLLPASVRMDVLWDGTLETTATGDAGVQASASWNFQASAFGGVQLAEYHSSAAILASGLPQTGNPAHDFRSVADARSFVMPLSSTNPTVAPFVDFSLILSALGSVSTGFDGGGGTATADFNDTGRITGLAFFDASGADITGAVAYAFVNGTQIHPLVSPVPEPATLTLLAGGAALLGIVVRRRRA